LTAFAHGVLASLTLLRSIVTKRLLAIFQIVVRAENDELADGAAALRMGTVAASPAIECDYEGRHIT